MNGPVDVEGELIGYLAPLVGVPVSTRIPNPRPASHVKVTRAGGQQLNLVQERPLMIVECWAGTSPAAFALAAEAVGHLRSHRWFSPHEGFSSPVNQPDPDTTAARYQFTCQPYVTYEEAV